MFESLHHLWNNWEIRVLLMCSLGLQMFLLIFAGQRKRVVPVRMSQSTTFSLRAPLNIVFHWLLWLSYLSADVVATTALGYLSQYDGSGTGTGSSPQNWTKHLVMFWTPFLLLHLGGQDTITALSIEDNELWLRHLLTLVYHVAFSIYVYWKSNPIEGGLWPAAIPMFIAGVVKYAERTWSLQRASMSGLWSSIVNVPDPSPNHAKLMEEYTSNQAAGIPAQIVVIPAQRKFAADPEGQTISNTNGNLEGNSSNEPYSKIVCQAYRFFRMFRGLFVDLILSLENWEESQNYFRKLSTNDAYKVIEIELLLMYEMLHTKAALLHNWYGCAFRVITLVCSLAALCIFTVHHKSGFGQTEINVTYLLLVGAVGLDIISLFSMLTSVWTFAALMNNEFGRKVAEMLFVLVKKLWPMNRSLWSNQMSQYNLISFSVKDQSCLRSEIMKIVGLKNRWDNYRHATYVSVETEIKDLLLEELKGKMNMAVNDHRGQWALLQHGYYNELGWSVENEFEKSILIWHIATDLLFHANSHQTARKGQHISNYMLFLLIMRPFMLPAGIGQIQFQATCAEARNYFKSKRYHDDGNDDHGPRHMILKINTRFDPSANRNSGSMSVFFDGCKLAHQLQDIFEKDVAAMWQLINAVWVEMLCFAANKCSGQFHAKQMSKGGEFLTIVWMLNAHLGLGDQCKVEVNYNNIVKLVVQK